MPNIAPTNYEQTGCFLPAFNGEAAMSCPRCKTMGIAALMVWDTWGWRCQRCRHWVEYVGGEEE